MEFINHDLQAHNPSVYHLVGCSAGWTGMKPRISEFSYGFALTNELVGWAELSAAPVFPSLIEEGRAGGGYDVKLERPGVPLFLQFKRSEFLTRRSGREAREIAKTGARIGIPYYRFAVTESWKSDQHELLLALDVAPNFVFYAAPRFYRVDEINAAWHANAVASRSIFVAPHQIGTLTDEPHAVAFDRQGVWVCSEPRRIESLSSRDLADKLLAALNQDERPLRDKLGELTDDLHAAEVRGRERIYQRSREELARREEALRRSYAERSANSDQAAVDRILPAWSVPSEDLAESEPPFEVPESLPGRVAKDLAPELLQLRQAADTAARLFDTQLVIVQP